MLFILRHSFFLLQVKRKNVAQRKKNPSAVSNALSWICSSSNLSLAQHTQTLVSVLAIRNSLCSFRTQIRYGHKIKWLLPVNRHFHESYCCFATRTRCKVVKCLPPFASASVSQSDNSERKRFG